METVSNEISIRSWSSYSRSLIEDFGDEGDAARRYLLNPTLYALLGKVAGRHILDAGCGTGYLCRLLAKRGAKVTGVEPASTLFSYAVEREQAEPLGIVYVQQDLSQFTVPTPVFDVVIANMVFMDIPEYKTAICNCVRALRPGGQFIFSLLHPCFDEIDSPAFVKGYAAKGYVRIDEYLNEFVVAQTWGYNLHRPLSAYLNLVIEEGCTIRKVIEPTPTREGIAVLGEHDRNLHVPNFIVISTSKQ